MEPQLLDDNRWGRLFSLAYNGLARFALGLSRGGAIEIGAGGPRALGNAPLVLLDLRPAALGLGDNGGFVVANSLIDVFAPDEPVTPTPAVAADAPAGHARPPAPRPPVPAPAGPPLARRSAALGSAALGLMLSGLTISVVRALAAVGRRH